jgi:hypothetical protein
MDKIRVLIDNWQKDPWYHDWIPIFIAVISLIVSLFSLYWSRKDNIISHRPYVWANNYGVIDNVNKTIISIPFRIAFRVKNSPAKILSLQISISANSKQLFENTESNFVQFPDESSEWNFGFDKVTFDKIMDRTIDEKRNLIRKVEITYSSLDGGKIYNYKLVQAFIPEDNQWRKTDEVAN